ncbi:MAG: hypothetical protein P8Z40_15545 [Chloroflexota bacterium]
MKQRKFLLLALFVTAALVAAACAPSPPPTQEQAAPEDPWGVIEVAPSDPIRVAVNVVTSQRASGL